MTRTRIYALVLLIFVAPWLAGCEDGLAWLDQRTGVQAIEDAVDLGEVTIGDLDVEIDLIKADIKALQEKPTLTPEEAAFLIKLQSTLTDAEEKLDDTNKWLKEAGDALAEIPTNGDMLVKAAELSGIPFVGLIASLFGMLRANGRTRGLIENLEKNPLVNLKGNSDLEMANVAAGLGLESFITKTRAAYKKRNPTS